MKHIIHHIIILKPELVCELFFSSVTVRLTFNYPNFDYLVPFHLVLPSGQHVVVLFDIPSATVAVCVYC